MVQRIVRIDTEHFLPFGTREYGRIYSVSQLMSMLGLASGPALVGLVNEATGGYVVPFLVIAAASMFGGLILALSGPSRQEGTNSGAAR